MSMILNNTVARMAKQSAKGFSAVRYMSKETYTERQEKTGRPLSPHVQIYKFPPAALSSITNRVTGVLLYTGIAGVGAIALGGGDASSVMSTIGNTAGLGMLAKFAVSFPLVYHYAGGIRHVMWDKNPEMLQNEDVTQSSYILVGASTAVSVALALM